MEIGPIRALLESLPEDSEIIERMKRAGVEPSEITSREALARIPVLRKDALAALQDRASDYAAVLPGHGLGGAARIFVSPGFILDFEARSDNYWLGEDVLRAAGVGPGDVILNTFSYHMTTAARMFEEAALLLGATVVPTGPGQIEQQLEIMRRVAATCYIGLPSFLSMLIDKAEAAGLEWRREFAIRTAVVTAEPISASARRRFETEYGIDVYATYGTSDVGLVGYECDRHEGWHVNDNALIEICDPDSSAPLPTGETGEVVISLARSFYPMVRLATGDLSAFLTEPCACGRPSQRLAGFLGRSNQATKVRGMFVYPSFAREIAAAHDWIAGVRFEVRRDGETDIFDVLVHPTADGAARADVAAVEATVRAVTKLRGTIRLVEAEAFNASDAIIDDKRSWD
jgi:phenylacetate-CoA ligase